MAVKSIIRAKGAAGEREVGIADIVIYDVRACPLFLPDERWIGAVSHYYDDLVALLATVRADGKLPQEFFVPDLWHTSILLPMQEHEMMLDMWHLGHDLAKGIGYNLLSGRLYPQQRRRCGLSQVLAGCRKEGVSPLRGNFDPSPRRDCEITASLPPNSPPNRHAVVHLEPTPRKLQPTLRHSSFVDSGTRRSPRQPAFRSPVRKPQPTSTAVLRGISLDGTRPMSFRSPPPPPAHPANPIVVAMPIYARSTPSYIAAVDNRTRNSMSGER